MRQLFVVEAKQCILLPPHSVSDTDSRGRLYLQIYLINYHKKFLQILKRCDILYTV